MRFLLPFTLMAASLVAQTPGKVESHGLDIHFRIYGQGKPILLLGGGPGDVAERYTALAELLAKHARVILVEQRGTGRSTPKVKDASTLTIAKTLDDFEAIRTHLKLKQWTVLGFSYGGYLASLYAHHHPESLSALMLLGSMGLNWEGQQIFEDNVTSRMTAEDRARCGHWSQPDRMKADPQIAITELIKAKLPGYFFDRGKALLEAATIRPEHFDFEMGEWIYKDTVARKLDLSKLEVRFRGPVLVLHGRQDPTGESVPQALARHYPSAKLNFIERCGHYGWIEHPEKVGSLVSEFMAH